MLDDRITESRRTTPVGRDLPGPIEVEDISEESLRRRHEAHDLDLRPILRFLLILLLAAVVIFLLLWWMMRAWTDEALPIQPQLPPAAVTAEPMLGPGVAPFSAIRLQAERADQRSQLERYGWVDREAGVVHIPVERAMQLLVERGIPARADSPAPSFELNPAYELESEGGLTDILSNTVDVGTGEPETAEQEATNEDN